MKECSRLGVVGLSLALLLAGSRGALFLCFWERDRGGRRFGLLGFLLRCAHLSCIPYICVDGGLGFVRFVWGLVGGLEIVVGFEERFFWSGFNRLK